MKEKKRINKIRRSLFIYLQYKDENKRKENNGN